MIYLAICTSLFEITIRSLDQIVTIYFENDVKKSDILLINIQMCSVVLAISLVYLLSILKENENDDTAKRFR